MNESGCQEEGGRFSDSESKSAQLRWPERSFDPRGKCSCVKDVQVPESIRKLYSPESIRHFHIKEKVDTGRSRGRADF